MSENLCWYTKAIYGFDHVVRLAPAGNWDRPSPCEGWTARHVVGHVLAIQRYVEASARGVEPTMNPMVDPHTHCGDDPASAWAATRDAVLAALDTPGALDVMLMTFRGEERIDDMIGLNIVDTTVHAWDLARALDVDTRLDPTLIDRCTELFLPLADIVRAPALYGDPVEVADGADAQTRLLALAGRRT